jgi:hypothetical protein
MKTGFERPDGATRQRLVFDLAVGVQALAVSVQQLALTRCPAPAFRPPCGRRAQARCWTRG